VPNYEKVNDVVAGSVAGVNGVAVANIQNVNGQDKPTASGASLWVMLQDDSQAGYASNSAFDEASDWTFYDANSSGSDTDFIALCFGKNGSGQDHWVGSWQKDSTEIGYTSDPTNDTAWTTVNLGARVYEIAWGNDVWIGIGKMVNGSQKLHRSTDGINWSEIDLSGVAGIGTSSVFALTTNGAGRWWFGADDRIFESTDNGQSWASIHQFSGWASGTDIDNIAYTNNSLVAIASGDIYSAAISDLTDWSSGVEMASGGSSRHLCSYQGRVCIALSAYFWTFDVDGKTITGHSGTISSGTLPRTDISTQSHSGAQTINTDGTTWMIGCDTGDIFWTTDPADANSFSNYILNLNSSKHINDIKPDVILPL